MSTDTSAVSGVARYDALDSLRGIAAFCVLISHTVLTHPGESSPLWQLIKWWPLRVLWSGHQAVVLFFILSGFSLYLLYESLNKRPAATRLFFVSRWLRLYPVYAISILAAFGLYALTDSLNFPRRDAAFFVPSGGFDLAELARHLSLVGLFDVMRFNPPIWSIVHEMRISLLFPLIFFAVRSAPAVTTCLGITVSLCVAGFFYSDPLYSLSSWQFSVLSTAHYTTFFVTGAVIACYRNYAIAVMTGCRSYWPVILCVSLALYTYPNDDTWTIGQVMFGDLLIGVGSAGLMMLALAFPVLSRSALLRYLGRISYSLYLIHFSCRSAVHILVGDAYPAPLIWLLTIALSVIAADLVWRGVERYSLRWSRQIRIRKPPEYVMATDS